MPVIARPRRSALYMPGSRPRALDKARSLPADVLLLDLEDAVAPSEKDEARRLVAEAVAAGAFGRREVVIRVNGLDTPWGVDDLAAAAAARPDAVLLPKVVSAAQVAEAAAHLGAAAPALWAMIETPLGVLRAAEIAEAPGMACFVLGTNDLAKELRAEHVPGRAPLLTALGISLLAARAQGLACLDGVYNAFRDTEGFRAECEQGRAMGFDGKTLIHPDQLAIANDVFAPSAAALDLARAQLAAHEAALARGEGVAVVDGRIVENLHVENARRLLAEAEAIRALDSEAA
jgi:citrate lyase beta subunit